MLLSRCKAQFDPEPAAFAWLGFNADFAAHALCDFARNGEANAGAFVPIIELLEHPKETFLRVLGNPDSVILNPNAADTVAELCPDADLWLDPRCNELHGIAEQVGETLG